MTGALTDLVWVTCHPELITVVSVPGYVDWPHPIICPARNLEEEPFSPKRQDLAVVPPACEHSKGLGGMLKGPDPGLSSTNQASVAAL